MNKEPLGYLGGDIMTHGSNLARQEEYDKFKAAGIPGNVYSPVQNKSINDKSNMTEEENNHLAEKIVAADVERLWNSDYTVLCPEQSAIGTMCEMGILYGWKYMADIIMHEVHDYIYDNFKGDNKWPPQLGELTVEQKAQLLILQKNVQLNNIKRRIMPTILISAPTILMKKIGAVAFLLISSCMVLFSQLQLMELFIILLMKFYQFYKRIWYRK